METIVVGLEESAGSKAAVAWASSYALERGARVLVVDALPGMWEVAAVQVNPDRIEAEEAKRLREVVCAPLRDSGVEFRAVMQEGDPAHALVENAKQSQASLIVYGHTVHSGVVSEHVIGATLHKLLTHAHCPVVVVPVREA